MMAPAEQFMSQSWELVSRDECAFCVFFTGFPFFWFCNLVEGHSIWMVYLGADGSIIGLISHIWRRNGGGAHFQWEKREKWEVYLGNAYQDTCPTLPNIAHHCPLIMDPILANTVGNRVVYACSGKLCCHFLLINIFVHSTIFLDPKASRHFGKQSKCSVT